MKLVLVIILLVAVVWTMNADHPAESNYVIDTVNSANTTWKAGKNFDVTFKKSQVKNLLGHRKQAGKGLLPVLHHEKALQDIPSTFDARARWPQCVSLNHIPDQSDCGSCWAVSAAAVFSDRLCIASNAEFRGQLSAAQLLSCCTECGNCGGGYYHKAWMYFQENGIVTGGDYYSKDGCQPYPLEPCEHSVNGSRVPCEDMGYPSTPTCYHYCTNAYYPVPFDKDHYQTKTSYAVESIVEAIQQEIIQSGPVQAGFTVYTDFLSYKTGVYQHITGNPEGGHAVKIIGWGVEGETNYWLVANSWNTDWGDHGFFKIKRGNNECGIESEISAGIPKVLLSYF